MKAKLYLPLYPCTITQGFGQNLVDYSKYGLKGHNGLDLIRGFKNGKEYPTEGANVRASHDGQVVYTGLDGGTGYIVVLRTLETMSGYGDYTNQEIYFKSIYGHVQPNIPVRVGQNVKTGDIIAYADNTGNSSGSHCHFGWKPIYQGEKPDSWDNVEQNNGYRGAIDPLPYFTNGTLDISNAGFAYEIRRIFELSAMVEALKRQILALLSKN